MPFKPTILFTVLYAEGRQYAVEYTELEEIFGIPIIMFAANEGCYTARTLSRVVVKILKLSARDGLCMHGLQ